MRSHKTFKDAPAKKKPATASKDDIAELRGAVEKLGRGEPIDTQPIIEALDRLGEKLAARPKVVGVRIIRRTDDLAEGMVVTLDPTEIEEIQSMALPKGRRH